MTMYDILNKKKHGEELTAAEIRFFVEGYTKGSIPDYQASAFTMAVCLKGMTAAETAALTEAMAHSGDTVDLSCFGTLSADKHSTGGVGDKTSLIVAPIVAALGGKVTKMSGRGLGHTGGTVDKLESIPDFRTTLTSTEFLRQVETVGMAVIGQSGDLAPADKKLYALRDVTATVDSIPLIASSIMSKKLAAGSQNIVLDVKVGSGAFMKTPEDAADLADEMVRIGKLCGRRMAALITDMNAPLGCAVGNAVEIQEAIGVLRGDVHGDLRTVCVALAAQMLTLIFGWEESEAEARVNTVLQDGTALAKMREWVVAQGGDGRYIDDPTLFHRAAHSFTVPAPDDGYIAAMDTEAIGRVAVLLGAGRENKEDTIDHGAGILLQKKSGDAVQKGDPLCILLTERAEILPEAAELYVKALTFTETPPPVRPLIHQTLH
ncbi:MAG: thymidine phosphorylase [Ruminococcaceae bacterium]|nr:thymidine phosphorylase [Oscillospiraceae bacterium]